MTDDTRHEELIEVTQEDIERRETLMLEIHGLLPSGGADRLVEALLDKALAEHRLNTRNAPPVDAGEMSALAHRLEGIWRNKPPQMPTMIHEDERVVILAALRQPPSIPPAEVERLREALDNADKEMAEAEEILARTRNNHSRSALMALTAARQIARTALAEESSNVAGT